PGGRYPPWCRTSCAPDSGRCPPVCPATYRPDRSGCPSRRTGWQRRRTSWRAPAWGPRRPAIRWAAPPGRRTRRSARKTSASFRSLLSLQEVHRIQRGGLHGVKDAFRRHVPHLLRQQLRRVLLSGGRLAQVEVLQLPLGISHGGVGIQQRTAGALQLPVLQAA
ncbi:XF1762 family protein, partial [Dysosmobacter welbionis]